MEEARADCYLASRIVARCVLMKTRQRIRLHLTTGRTVEGVILSTRRKLVTLGDVRIEVDGKMVPTPLEHLYVPRERIEFAQSVVAGAS